ncbi:MAG: glycosyltransferase family 4 protein [Oscillospiraceae bacterium]|nr:glycosyltransferase family 4 protein [Oscillospiraceae bacterium]
MKILIIRNFPSYMAVINATYNIQELGLAKALVRKGHVCDILFWTDREEKNVIVPVDGIGEVRVFYRHGKTLLKNTIYTGCETLFADYDILQPCEYNQMQSWLLAGKYPDKTVIYHGPYYCDFNRRYNLMCSIFDKLFLKRYIVKGTKFLVKSELAETFLADKGIDPRNIATVGVGVDIQMLTSPKGTCSEPLYQTMEKDQGRLKLLYIGRFEERRNIPFLLDIFEKVLQQNKDARLYMIGSGDREYMEMVFSYMDKLSVRDRVIWQEQVEQRYLAEIYAQADFFLLPTKYEIFGMVLPEAMYYGAVVLTTKNGGSATLIQNGENGFILDEDHAQPWAECILRMHQDRTGMRRIRTAAAAMSDSFTWDALSVRFIEQYEARLNES